MSDALTFLCGRARNTTSKNLAIPHFGDYPMNKKRPPHSRFFYSRHARNLSGLSPVLHSRTSTWAQDNAKPKASALRMPPRFKLRWSTILACRVRAGIRQLRQPRLHKPRMQARQVRLSNQTRHLTTLPSVCSKAPSFASTSVWRYAATIESPAAPPTAQTVLTEPVAVQLPQPGEIFAHEKIRASQITPVRASVGYRALFLSPQNFPRPRARDPCPS
jgi:hypothetical protein